ncbi:MAG: 5-(carboxyamino)imidazole ribonucleotide synthase [Chloroflexi bacterium]|nr:5-(carboxyamino)imidazole ribonucleotide synthase [Chloroflexota bacterium]
MIVGVLGGGQLGRMLALAGYPLGIHVRALDPLPDAPAGALCELITGHYDQPETLARLVDNATVITYEFENVPLETARLLAQSLPVYPPPQALETAQDRLVEKSFLRQLGIPTPPFLPVDSRADLDVALAQFGLPAVLKTRRMGYDGKGQAVIRQATDADAAWDSLQGAPLILEGWVKFAREVSLLAVRSSTGELAFYPLIENEHRDGILRISRAPAPNLTVELQALAESYARSVLAALAYVGVLAIEFFQVGQYLLANEMAPRVHNSGHWTIEGATTSQFANHLRAILGLPLGATAAIGHSVMVNLIGTLPDSAAVLGVAGAQLHLYDKAPRAGRKVGHITLRADDPGVLAEQLAALQQVLDL